MDAWKMNFLLGWPNFRRLCQFQGGYMFCTGETDELPSGLYSWRSTLQHNAPSLCRRSSVTAFLLGLMHGMENLAPAHESNMNQYNFRSSGLMMMFIWCIWFFHELHFIAYLDDWYVESFRYIIHQAWPFNATWWSERNGLKLCETHDLGDVLSFIVNRFL